MQVRKDVHVLREVWQALEEGRLSAVEIDQMVLDHLLGLCATCESEYRAFRRGQLRERYDSAFRRTRDWIASKEGANAVRLRRSREDFRILLALSESARVDRVGRARSRFRGVQLGEQLLAKSWECLPSNPQGALHWATLARSVVEGCREPGSAEARVLAYAYEGNALRILTRFAEARRLFDLARQSLASGADADTGGVTDLGVYARVDWLEGAFFRTLREFGQAEFLISRAALFFGLVQDEELQTRVLVTLGELHRVKGDVDEAIRTIGIVLERVDPEQRPELYFNCRFNYALYLAEAELFALARDESN